MDLLAREGTKLLGWASAAGFLWIANSGGLYPASAGTKNNFGFNVKYNSGGTTLHGNINTIFLNGARVYQIKGNAMTSLAVTQLQSNGTWSSGCPNGATSTAPCKAIFNGKANIQDITDPLNAISIDGNATLQVSMTDDGQPGKNDTIAITVWNKSGGMFFSSDWDGKTTLEKILGGGSLSVH